MADHQGVESVMKAGTLYYDCDFRLGDVPEPVIRPNEVVVNSM